MHRVIEELAGLLGRPDWWDLHDGSKLPGSMHWRPVDDEWSSGDFGFVWGCVWGDDSSWKVQHLDVSGVSEGVILRDDRFGYLKLATNSKLLPRDFIRCSSWKGERRAEFYVERGYNLTTGAPSQPKTGSRRGSENDPAGRGRNS